MPWYTPNLTTGGLSCDGCVDGIESEKRRQGARIPWLELCMLSKINEKMILHTTKKSWENAMVHIKLDDQWPDSCVDRFESEKRRQGARIP